MGLFKTVILRSEATKDPPVEEDPFFTGGSFASLRMTVKYAPCPHLDGAALEEPLDEGGERILRRSLGGRLEAKVNQSDVNGVRKKGAALGLTPRLA
jgi:hypothetical protein